MNFISADQLVGHNPCNVETVGSNPTRYMENVKKLERL